MLNNASMLLKSDLWTFLIDGFAKWLVNYGWAIILFTVCLKLVLSPLDIFQRVSSQKQSRTMGALKPEMDALQKKYGDDKARINQETTKLYKKYNINVGGMCLSMLLTLTITMVVFFTLFASIRSYGDKKLYSSYTELDKAYVTAEADFDNGTVDTTLTKNEYVLDVVEKKYKELKKENGWLWVKNVWKSDTKTSQFVDFDAYVKKMKIAEGEVEAYKTRYEAIKTTILDGKKDNNGYYVLIIVAGLVSFLTQFISAKVLAPKGQKLNMTNIIMLVIIPISMLFFAMSSNVIFTLYIITNSIMSALISTTISLIMRRKDKGKTDEQILMSNKKIEVVEYSRNYKK